jgi:S-adenosylmethionine:tRNA ribosyltransferase-isomerase
MKPQELDLPVLPNIDATGRPYDDQAGSTRMAVLDKTSAEVHLCDLNDLVKYLEPGDLVVVNSSRVARSQFSGKIHSADAVVNLRGFIDGCTWAATVESQIAVKPGDRIRVEDVDIEVVRAAPADKSPLWVIRFHCEESEMDRLLEATHPDIGAERARPSSCSRSVALPTASALLCTDLLAELRQQGVHMAEIILHAGLPTFEKCVIDEETVDLHRVPGERYSISVEAAEEINRAVAAGRRVVAVGTTVLRAVETAALGGMPLTPCSAWTTLAIYPGFHFRVCNSLMTGFHPSRSSHLALAVAFTGRDLLFRGYTEAVQAGYRFAPDREITLTLGW